MRITVGNLKGGTSKTTSAVHLALGLSEMGRTLLIDADPEQPMAYEWSEVAEGWPHDRCLVEAHATRDLVGRVRGKLPDYEHVVFDVGPKNPVVFRQAMALSDVLLIPTRPTPAEVRELDKVFDLAEEVDAISPLVAGVLLVQVQTSSRAGQAARDALGEQGRPVLRSQVRLLSRFAMSFGTVPDDLTDYSDVLKEITAHG